MGSLFNNITKSDYLTPDQELEYIKLSRTGNKNATEKLIKSVYISIVKCARTFNRPDMMDDLISEGVYGVMKAIEKYDPKYKMKFYGYCQPLIKAYQQRMMEKMNRLTSGNMSWKAAYQQPKYVSLDTHLDSAVDRPDNDTLLDLITGGTDIMYGNKQSNIDDMLDNKMGHAIIMEEADALAKTLRPVRLDILYSRIATSDMEVPSIQIIASTHGISRQVAHVHERAVYSMLTKNIEERINGTKNANI